MKVELTSDAVDSVMKSVLLDDYRSLCEDITRLSSSDKLARYQKEDLEHNLRYKQAMETILEYYIGMRWKEEL